MGSNTSNSNSNKFKKPLSLKTYLGKENVYMKNKSVIEQTDTQLDNSINILHPPNNRYVSF